MLPRSERPDVLANNKSLRAALIGVSGHGAMHLRGTLGELNTPEETCADYLQEIACKQSFPVLLTPYYPL
jgi:hypothetical protein